MADRLRTVCQNACTVSTPLSATHVAGIAAQPFLFLGLLTATARARIDGPWWLVACALYLKRTQGRRFPPAEQMLGSRARAIVGIPTIALSLRVPFLIT